MPIEQDIPEASLEVIEADGTRRTVGVTHSPFLVGRGSDAGNHLQLADPRISRNCAALVYEDGAFRLQDRGSRCGLFVNGERIDSRALRDADAITFGLADGVQLVFHHGQARETLPQLLAQLGQAGSLAPEARDLRHLNLLLEATTLLQSQMPLEELLGAMLDSAITLTTADRGLLLEADAAGGLRPLLARRREGGSLPVASVVPSKTVLAQVLDRRRSVIEEDVRKAEAALRGAGSVVAQQLGSVIAIPLVSHQMFRASDATFLDAPINLVGVLYLDSRRPLAFSGLERRILDTLALEAASVLENARLVKKERERLRLEQELSTARRIQQALLPKSFQDFPHFQITGINRSCQAVGGDYFDLMELSPDRTAFVIADVCGKGLGAALVTAILQGTFSAMTAGRDLAQVFAHVNRFICARSDVQRYATLFFGILDATGRLEFINAGHPPPLRVRGGRAESVFAAQSLPVGLFPETEFQAEFSALEPGDTLVFFTDGINEAMDPQRQTFGVERLKHAVESRAKLGVEELRTGILAAVEEFTRGAPQADDITLLILRYHGIRKAEPAAAA